MMRLAPWSWKSRLKGVVLISLLSLALVLYFRWGPSLTLEKVAQHETELRALQQREPVLVYGLAFLAYVVVTALSLPFATALTLAVGWYFGFWIGLILVSCASTLGATLAFLLSRYLFYDWVAQRWGERLARFLEAWKQEGAYYLLGLRLAPGVPFFVVNLVMGLTPIRVRTFWWVSQLGMLPGTMLYVFAGSRVPNLKTLDERGLEAIFSPVQLTQIFLAFTLLGLFPIFIRWLIKRLHLVPNQPTPQG
jgi:uncharacterized membrane protein YdjX (TVP38/TMEM64 family)